MSLKKHQQCVYVFFMIGVKHCSSHLMSSKAGPVCNSTCAVLHHGRWQASSVSAGIPNSGKSTLINALRHAARWDKASSGGKAATGSTPGLTRRIAGFQVCCAHFPLSQEMLPGCPVFSKRRYDSSHSLAHSTSNSPSPSSCCFVHSVQRCVVTQILAGKLTTHYGLMAI